MKLLTAGGLVLLAAQPAPLLLSAPVLTAVPVLRRLAPVLSGRGRADSVALTFDDGPDPGSTPLFLDALRRLDVRATFFLLGSHAQHQPDLVRRIADEGHELAVHGWDHRNQLRHLSPRRTTHEVARTAELLTTLTGTAPVWFRPPYGAVTAAGLAAARRAGLRTVLWTAWGRDWEPTATAESVVRTMTRTLIGGGTALLHDSDCTSAPGSWRAALGALPALHAWCGERELTLGPLRSHGL